MESAPTRSASFNTIAKSALLADRQCVKLFCIREGEAIPVKIFAIPNRLENDVRARPYPVATTDLGCDFAASPTSIGNEADRKHKAQLTKSITLDSVFVTRSMGDGK